MRDFLKKTEITFALKVSLLFSMVILASIVKKEQESDKNIFAKNISVQLPTTVFANF